MARISSYPYDNTVQDNDAWIGTENSSRRTKQFTASAVEEAVVQEITLTHCQN
jgi:hypothetical protein